MMSEIGLLDRLAQLMTKRPKRSKQPITIGGIVAIIIAVISIAALARAQRWEEWINLLAGIWLFISPWLLKYSGTRNALWDAVIIGAVVVILAAWDLIAMQRTVHHHA